MRGWGGVKEKVDSAHCTNVGKNQRNMKDTNKKGNTNSMITDIVWLEDW